MSYYKHCFIPQCKNNIYNTPNKIFISVPKSTKERKAWFEAAGRNVNGISSTTHFDCCEDHFNLQEDMENYMKFKMMGCKKRMKRGIVPHIFNFKTGDFSKRCKKEAKTRKNLLEFVSNEENLNELQTTETSIQNHPEIYLGINKNWYKCGFISILSQQTKICEQNIKLTLMKIKLNDSFNRLGEKFGISETAANEIFNKTVPNLYNFLKQLVYCPEKESIRKLLPIPFKNQCQTKLKSILYCLEVKISIPSDSLRQSLTWSDCKNSHTLKYLISSTADGFIDFISKGYGGRITDLQLVENSKSILPLLKNKKCDLLTQPNVFIDDETISNLRVHIVKVVNLLKEFELLNSVVHSSLIPQIDYIIVIASALINLQILFLIQ